LVYMFGRRWSMCLAFVFYAGGALGMMLVRPASSYWLAVAPMLAIGLASGFVSPAATAPALGTVEKHRAGVAAAVLNAARQTGGALGVAIFGALIAAHPSFETGIRITLLAAAAVSFLAVLVWWFTLSPKRVPSTV
jgi:DHA2 family methylenomycin A resistance protein-like MFS transporter